MKIRILKLYTIRNRNLNLSFQIGTSGFGLTRRALAPIKAVAEIGSKLRRTSLPLMVLVTIMVYDEYCFKNPKIKDQFD